MSIAMSGLQKFTEPSQPARASTSRAPDQFQVELDPCTITMHAPDSAVPEPSPYELLVEELRALLRRATLRALAHRCQPERHNRVIERRPERMADGGSGRHAKLPQDLLGMAPRRVDGNV